MNNLKSFCLVTLFGIFIQTVLQAQEGSITVRSIPNKTTVEFKGSDGKITKTMSVEDLNPYKDGFQPKTSSNSRESKVANTNVKSKVSNTGNKTVAFSYSVKLYNEDRHQLQEQGESTIVVYGVTGLEIFKQRIEADNAGEPLVAPNGKYVAVSFGGLVHDDKTKKIGFSIYDLETKSLLMDIPTDDISGAWVNQDVFVFSSPDNGFGSTRTYYIFDTRNKVLYKKSYNKEQRNLLKRFENEGVIFLLPPDAERLEKYETHFIKVSQ